MFEQKKEIKEQIKALEEYEERLTKTFTNFCREIELQEDFRKKDMKRNEDMFQLSGGDPELTIILDERNCILDGMKSECNKHFEEIEYKYNESLDKLKTERDELYSELENEQKRMKGDKESN